MLTDRVYGGTVGLMDTSSPPAAVPFVVRARLTPAEFLELRTIALRTKTAVPDLVAAALRVSYPLTPKEDLPA